MLRQLLGCVTLVSLALLSSCGKTHEKGMKICAGAHADSYSSTFKIWCPSRQSDNFLLGKYGCSPIGQEISPPIYWEGVPSGATRLRVQIVDTTCTYDCNDCCRFSHWILDFSLKDLPESGLFSLGGVQEGAASSPDATKYSRPNTVGKVGYTPFCPPEGQTHAYVYEAIAYHLDGSAIVVDGRSLGVPFLFSTNH